MKKTSPHWDDYNYSGASNENDSNLSYKNISVWQQPIQF